ncbi:MAG: hypothetical protein IIA87_03600 [Nanoarchaeota archaeon]|nr:hypothetical protein [Nanoarchaeota archaeon]
MVSDFQKFVHKEAVKFRNKMRKKYLNGSLSPTEEIFVEAWDCNPKTYLVTEEPLTIDVNIKFMMKQFK